MSAARLRRPHLPKPKPLNTGRRNLLKGAAAAVAGAIAAEIIEGDGEPLLPEDAAAQVARAKADAAKAKADEAAAEADNAELRNKISKARKALKKEDS